MFQVTQSRKGTSNEIERDLEKIAHISGTRRESNVGNELKLTASQGCFDASSADGRFLEKNENENKSREKCIWRPDAAIEIRQIQCSPFAEKI